MQYENNLRISTFFFSVKQDLVFKKPKGASGEGEGGGGSSYNHVMTVVYSSSLMFLRLCHEC